ncbi:hypothetical protein C5S29_06800 [ANME-1 cluster archaeon GoMg3.2]|nr:hypothetical protein [ANME-1 cluster archaeon GoMg3.2]
MKKTKTKLTGVVAIAMALTIAFSGGALASQSVPTTKETEVLDITTNIKCNGSVVESQRLNLEIDSKNLLDNPPLADGEIYGQIKYGEKMIGLDGAINFTKDFTVDTSKTAQNLDVHKQIGYTAGFLGSLSHAEEVCMKVIAAGKTTTTEKKALCSFKKPIKTTKKVPGSSEEVHAYSEMFVTNVLATTTAKVGITKAPVNLNYRINAEGDGLVVAGVDLYVEDGRGGAEDALGSRWTYKEKSIAYDEFKFTKDIGYTSVYSP